MKVVLSPHLDDAVLSCWHILGREDDVRVVNVFTGSPENGDGDYTWDRLTGSQDSVDDDLLLQSKTPLAEVEGGVGLGQTYRVSFGVFSRVRLASFELENVPGVAPGVPLIGGEVLRRFRIFFDYARSRMTLEPNPHLHDRFRSSGPELQLRGAPDGAVRVHEIPARSAAALSGLAAGDLITAVDGTPVAELTYTRLQALLTRAGAFTLTVRRAGRTLTVVLDNPPAAAPPR